MAKITVAKFSFDLFDSAIDAFVEAAGAGHATSVKIFEVFTQSHHLNSGKLERAVNAANTAAGLYWEDNMFSRIGYLERDGIIELRFDGHGATGVELTIPLEGEIELRIQADPEPFARGTTRSRCDDLCLVYWRAEAVTQEFTTLWVMLPEVFRQLVLNCETVLDPEKIRVQAYRSPKKEAA